MLAWNVQLPIVRRYAEYTAYFTRGFESHRIVLERGQRRYGSPVDFSVISEIEDPGNTKSPDTSPLPELPPQRPRSARQKRPPSANASGSTKVKARLNDGLKPTPPNCVVRRHKDSDLRGEEVLEIAPSVTNLPTQVIALRELWSAVRLVVVIAMEHDFKSTRRRLLAKVLHERDILVQRVNRSAAAQVPGNGFVVAGAAKRHDRE
jgi:hypothetical protein